MRRICRGSAGFTLMEAMLATLLMVIVMGALATVTAQWLPNWDRGANRLQRVELLAAGLDRLVSDVAAAQYVSTGDVFAAPYFDGGELSVTFVRTTLGPNTLTGLEIVQIAETSDRLGIALVRRTAPFIPVGGQAAALNFANPVVMVRAPYRVTFSYAGPDRVWRDTWRGATQLPRAIRIRVRDAATSATLAESTATLVHAELPVRCAMARTIEECPNITAAANPASAGGLLGR